MFDYHKDFASEAALVILHRMGNVALNMHLMAMCQLDWVNVTALWEKNSVLEYSNMLNSSKYNYLAIWRIKRFTTSTLERWLTIFLIKHI